MSLPLAKSEPSSSAASRDAARDLDTAAVVTRPAAVKAGTVSDAVSPVHGLQAGLTRAFIAPPEIAEAEIQKVPFAVTLVGVTAFSGICWALLGMAIRAL